MRFDSELQFGPRANAAAHDDDFGIEDTTHGKDCGRDDPADLVDCGPRSLIGLKSIEDVAHGAAGRSAEPGVALDDAGAADGGFQGAEPQATRIIGVSSERQVGDFAGRATCAADEMAVREDAHADAGAERDKSESAGIAAVAAPMLPDRAKIDVGFDGDVDAEP